jgi:myo-inositol-1-phosphate synthase
LDTKPIRVAIAGVGNCASALIQGVEWYRRADLNSVHGLIFKDVSGFSPSDIEFSAAFDVDERKVGKPLEEAMFSPPNCTWVFQRDITSTGIVVAAGPVFDGIAPHMADGPEDETFRLSSAPPVDVARHLELSETDVLLCYLPVGSEEAARHYAEAALKAKVAFVNCIPVFIASDPCWAGRFSAAGIPIVGDDIKSQIGATIVHRTLARLFGDRGCRITRSYQLNVGGNTDFLNMREHARLVSKKRSKTAAVVSQIESSISPDAIHVGPSDYVRSQGDRKIAFIRIEGEGFAGAPLEIELRMAVWDSPNSAGVVIDALRFAHVARLRGIGGPLEAPSAYFMKSPPKQMRDDQARQLLLKLAAY